MDSAIRSLWKTNTHHDDLDPQDSFKVAVTQEAGLCFISTYRELLLKRSGDRADVPGWRVCVSLVIISKSGSAFTHTLCSSVISPQLRLM